MPELPQFDAGTTYLLKGETLTAIMDVIKENKIVLASGTFQEVGPDGSKVATIDLNVCVDGQPKTVTFLIAQQQQA
jgi:hypothetical protein